MEKFSELSDLIMCTLSKDFEGVKLLRVTVEPDFDGDGNEIFRVEVVFEGTPKELPAGFMTQAIRKIRPALIEKNFFQFPSMSFVSSADAQIASS